MTAIDALVLSAKTHKEVVEGRKEQQAWHASAENEKVLTWLKGNSIDYGKQHGDFFSRLQEGSGQWLLQGDTFRQWLVGENRTLFCQGIPGAGKTMVACTVINYLQTSSELYTQQVAIVYLYCNYRRRDQQDPADLLTSLAAQLAEKTETMPIQLQTLYEQHNKKKTRPRISELEGLVESLLCSFEKTYVVVDALDECLDNGGHGFSCHEVIALIQQIQSEGETILNLFATSRALPDITDVFKGENCSTLEISADEGDMRQFLKARLPKILARSLVRKFPDIQDEIVTAIIEAAGGMFLLAQLYMNSLRDKATVKVLKAALMGFQASARESTSPDLKATQLDKAYNEAMERITMQSPDQSELAILCLSWVVCAKRPLLAEELQFALAVEVGEKSFDEENITDLSHILSVCNGLVTYDEVTTVVRLVHYTTQDYLEKEKQNWLPDAELNLSKVCLTYIQFDSLLCECRSSDCEPCSRLYNDKGSYTSEYLKLDGALASKGPSFSSFNEETYCLHITTKLAPKAHRFLTYASAYWGFHVTQCFNAVEHCILKLLEPQSHRVVDFLWRFICLNIRWGFWSIHGDRHRLIE
ncbi:hypothetical protein BJ508DRAFT_215227 [Ascobolus immersus RN42]|uniref:Uncharacterized protein n=1 Tax=Ascobolus immersus RN42 TaxID=1160509 RepID=A0A3N4HQ30_ASCIM|nr:hypothetical protein BJ508DRAFT_215227 [Ascobolus immersus RN42]